MAETVTIPNNLNVTSIPVFKGEGYKHWSVRMRTILRTRELWEIVNLGVSDNGENLYSNRRELKKDAQALAMIQQGVHDTLFSRIAVAEASQEAWDTLKMEFQGDSQVQSVKLQGLRREFENLSMNEVLMKCLIGIDGIPESWDELIRVEKIFASSERSFRQMRSSQHHHKNKNHKNKGKSVWKRISGSTDEGKYSSNDARQLISNKQTRDQHGNSKKNDDWTPLTKTPSQVLKTEQITLKEPNTSKFCEYHNDFGYLTDNYYSMKMEIESAVKSG